MTEHTTCPNFPYFGASYPDAGCFDGTLRDLDDCDDEGNVYENDDNVPCPFCRSEDFIKHHSRKKGDEIKVRKYVEELKGKYK